MTAEPRAARRAALVRLLADGRFHSGEALAAASACRARPSGSRSANCVRTSAGYRRRSRPWLSPARADRPAGPWANRGGAGAGNRGGAGAAPRARHSRVHQRPPHGPATAAQRARHRLRRRAADGRRGRRGRPWVSPFAANVYLSLLWEFELPATALAGLSLAVGVAVADTLRGLGVAEVRLKWPNDVLWRGHKLGGILVELGGEAEGRPARSLASASTTACRRRTVRGSTRTGPTSRAPRPTRCRRAACSSRPAGPPRRHAPRVWRGRPHAVPRRMGRPGWPEGPRGRRPHR